MMSFGDIDLSKNVTSVDTEKVHQTEVTKSVPVQVKENSVEQKIETEKPKINASRRLARVSVFEIEDDEDEYE